MEHFSYSIKSAQQFVLLHTVKQWSDSKHDLNSSAMLSNHAALFDLKTSKQANDLTFRIQWERINDENFHNSNCNNE